MYGIFYIRPVSVGLDSQIWYLFIHITGHLNVRKMSETIDYRTFVGPLLLCDLHTCSTLRMLEFKCLPMQARVTLDIPNNLRETTFQRN